MSYIRLVTCLTLLVFPGHVKRVIDGDTYVLYNVGVSNEQKVRELGLQTAERGHLHWDEARDSAAAWLAKGSYTLRACEYDSFGRLLGVSSRGADTLSTWLIHLGLGVSCGKAPCPVLP